MRRTVLIVMIAVAAWPLRPARVSRSAPKRRPAARAPRAPRAPARGRRSAAGGNGGGRGRGRAARGHSAKRIIYFDFDSSEIKAEGTAIVARMRTIWPPTRPCTCGSKAIPMSAARANTTSGLGERRAQAVRRALLLQGVAEAQLTTVSYGAERPAATGSNEAAWAQIAESNRLPQVERATLHAETQRRCCSWSCWPDAR